MGPGLYRALADLVVLVHFAFVVFVLLGGLLVLWRPKVAYVHLPAALWGTLIELAGWVCPLTPLENRLRELGGRQAYGGDFVERYVLPVLYPEGLTGRTQLVLGAVVVLLNAAIYTAVLRARRRRRSAGVL